MSLMDGHLVLAGSGYSLINIDNIFPSESSNNKPIILSFVYRPGDVPLLVRALSRLGTGGSLFFLSHAGLRAADEVTEKGAGLFALSTGIPMGQRDKTSWEECWSNSRLSSRDFVSLNRAFRGSHELTCYW